MLAPFFDFLFKICYYIQPSKGNNMIKKIITDKNLIKYLTNREDNYLVIEYNTRCNRAWFKTETMPKRKPIALSRVIEL